MASSEYSMLPFNYLYKDRWNIELHLTCLPVTPTGSIEGIVWVRDMFVRSSPLRLELASVSPNNVGVVGGVVEASDTLMLEFEPRTSTPLLAMVSFFRSTGKAADEISSR